MRWRFPPYATAQHLGGWSSRGIGLHSFFRNPKPARGAFDRGAATTQISWCQTVGWPLLALAREEESPGSTEVRCRVTPGGGDPRESATETHRRARRLPGRRAARVKWCGKSAPRRRQRRRQGKPHREQDQVGAAGIPERSEMPGGPSRRRSGRSHEAFGDGRPRGMAITALWETRERDRTRLTRRLALPRWTLQRMKAG